jgi:hypothetical protein
LGWACIKFDDDGDTDELLAPPEWGAQSVMNCVPTSWALSSWRSSLPEDAEGDFGADAGDLPIDEGNSQQAPIEPQDGNTAPSSSSPAAATGPAAADADEDTSSEDASESGCSFARASASGAGGAFALFAALLVLRRPRGARKI